MYRHLRTKLHTTSRIFSPYPVTEDNISFQIAAQLGNNLTTFRQIFPRCGHDTTQSIHASRLLHIELGDLDRKTVNEVFKVVR